MWLELSLWDIDFSWIHTQKWDCWIMYVVALFSISWGNSILFSIAAAAASCFSRVRLCYPIDGSLPGSPDPGILQTRTLEWVAISFSNAWKWKVKVKLLSRVRLFVTACTAVYQAPLSMGFSRQEFWSGLLLSSPVFHSGSINLHFYQQYTRFSFPLHPCQYLLFLGILVRAFQTDVRFLIYIFLMTSNLSIFSWACWTSAYLPWKNVYSNLMSIFKLRSFLYWVVWALYIFWLLTCYQSHHLQIFSPVH